jgi:hypothetical protein
MPNTDNHLTGTSVPRGVSQSVTFLYLARAQIGVCRPARDSDVLAPTVPHRK